MGSYKLLHRLVLIAPLLVLVACSNNSDNIYEKILNKRDQKENKPERILTARQVAELPNWFTKNPELDSAEGTSSDRAHAELQLENKRQIVVAVIDSGVDIHHDDLKEKIWVNEKEIPNNNIDDDQNGYIDDVNGWNFLGGYDGNGNPVHIDQEQLEVTRELIKMKKLKKDLEDQGQSLSSEQQKYLDKISIEVKEALDEGAKALEVIRVSLDLLKENYEIIKDLLNVKFEEMTLANVTAVNPLDEAQTLAKQKILEVFNKGGPKDVARFLRVKGSYENERDYYYNEAFLPRAQIVKDNPEDFSDVKYGNNDVMGPGADHGTHVAGIIAANRNNGLGIQGIAENVKIMALRAVPDGDERDKDVALAIRYAADNGAHIINMSFGKGYSPQRNLVGEAFKYAERKGLLMVHAAGNESLDRDVQDRYPTRKVYDTSGKTIDTVYSWIDVGASSQFHSIDLVAAFTNYGQTTVDLFAPGVRLNSTIPGNLYATFSGTSMASPSAAGVAALVWSQDPQLTAVDLKYKLLYSVRDRTGLLVRLPSDQTKSVPFETLSIMGGIIDAYNALIQ